MGQHGGKGNNPDISPHHWPARGFATAADWVAGHGAHPPAAVATARDPTKGRGQCGWFLLLLLAPASISQRRTLTRSSWQESGKCSLNTVSTTATPSPARLRTLWKGKTGADVPT